jgi:hypothetical protein
MKEELSADILMRHEKSMGAGVIESYNLNVS